MTKPTDVPSTEEILASLLDFFAATPDQQSLRLNEYYKTCVQRGAAPHVSNPLVELAEALFEYCGSSTTIEFHPEAFFVGPLPEDVVSIMQELSKAINTMLMSDQQTLFAVEFLGKQQWNLIRQLAIDGLSRWADSKPKRHLGLYELLCHVAD